MKFLHEIQALQVSEDLTTEMALMLVNNVVKKRNLGNLYLKGLTLNMPNIFNATSNEATPAASTLTFSFANQTAKSVLAAPIANNGTPTFRALTLSDVQDFYTSVDKTQLNYWTLVGSDVYRSTGNVYIGNNSSYGNFKLQVTGYSYFNGQVLIGDSYLYGSYSLQVTGDIFGTNLTGSTTLLKTVGGVITRAIDGTDYYSPATIASANYWTLLSGNVYRQTGNVAIGTNNPTDRFQVHSNAAFNRVLISNTGDFQNGIRLYRTGGTVPTDWEIYNPNNSTSLNFYNGGNWLTIKATGEVGIKTTNPQYQLDVNGVGRFIDNLYVQSSTTSNSARIGLYQTGSNWWFIENVFPGHLKFTRGTTDYAMLTNDGKLLLGATSAVNGSLFQVTGSIYSSLLVDSTDDPLLKAVGGVITKATSADIATLLGAASNAYIKNQNSSAQTANYWISGVGRATSFHAELRYASTEIGDIKIEQESTNMKSKISYYWYGNETASMKFNRGGDGSGSSISFWTQLEGNATTEKVWITSDGKVGIGYSPVYKLDVNGITRTLGAFKLLPQVSGEYSSDATLSYYAAGNGVYLNGNNTGFLRLNADGNQHTGITLYGVNAGGNAHRMTFTTNNLHRASIESNGKFIIGTGENGSKIFQVNGGIRQNDVISGLVYANNIGEFALATAANIAATLGAGNYIQNQFSAAQPASAWVSGELRSDTYIKSGRKGFYGTYDYTQVQGIWSIDSGYSVSTASNDFGSQYGITYAYESGTTGTARRPLTGYSHQILFVSNGYVNAAISLGGKAYFGAEVAIGLITAPSGRLHVRDTSNVRFWLDNSSTNTPYAYFQVNTNSTPYLDIQAGDTITYRNISLNSLGGNVLIGTTSPNGTWKLQVNAGSSTGNGIYVNGNINATGNIVADGFFSGTSSDMRLKSDFKKFTVIDKIDQIEVFSYKHQYYKDGRQIGSSAQQLQQLFPEIVSRDTKGFLRVSDYGYSAIVLQLSKDIIAEMRAKDVAIWEQTHKHTEEIKKLKVRLRSVNAKLRRLEKRKTQ